jgi:hypothetical protein
MSVREYCTVSLCAVAACLILAPSLFALYSNISSAWPSFINLCTSAWILTTHHCLQAVSGYTPLILDLRRDCSFTDFQVSQTIIFDFLTS